MPDLPHPDDPMISEEEKETPEQRAEKAERLVEFRRFAEPMLAQIYVEGKTPFGLPQDEVVGKVSERIFDRIASENLHADPDFLAAATEVAAAVNSVTESNFVVGKDPVDVLRYYLAEAVGVDSGVDVAEIDYVKKLMEQNYQIATGKTLLEWAQEYHQGHLEADVNLEQSSKAADIFNRDYSDHALNAGNLTTVLKEYAKTSGVNNVDIREALKVLAGSGYVVPTEWNDEYAKLYDGEILISAIESINKELQTDEIVQALEASYKDLPEEELKSTSIGANDVLAVASLDVDIPDTWEACDGETQKVVKAAMKELAAKLGGKLGSSKGAPVIKFETKT